MTAPKLDTRPARKLTSREVTKILGGVLCVTRTNQLSGSPPHVTEQEMREFFRWLGSSPGALDSMLLGNVPEGTKTPGDNLGVCSVIGGLIGSLCEIADKRAVRTALLWWAETDAAWSAF